MTNLEEYEIDPRRPFFAEFCGDATHLGKTTISNRFRDYLEDLGLATKMVRFESERVTSSMRDGEPRPRRAWRC